MSKMLLYELGAQTVRFSGGCPELEELWGGPYSPLRDFLGFSDQGLRVCGYHPFSPDFEEPHLVNSLSHYPQWEEAWGTTNGHPHVRIGSAKVSAELISAACQATEELEPEKRAQLEALLTEFQDVFVETYGGAVGRLDPSYGIVHELRTGDARPVTQRPYRHSQAEQAFVSSTVSKLLDQGLIRPSKSPWMSPVVCPPKKGGELRFAIDYRALNAVTEPDPYPLPLLQELLGKVAGYRWNTTIDVGDAFWAIELAPDAVPKTGFTTPVGNYEWLRMPFGLQSASGTFQRAIEQVVDGLPNSAPFIDDICTFSRDWDAHIWHIRCLLERLRKSGLRAKLRKCVFAARNLPFVGALIGEDGIAPARDKIEAILALPQPTTLTAMRSFLGMTNVFRDYIPGYATLEAPLRAHTRQGATIPSPWTEEMEQAFKGLKEALTTAPILRPPVWDDPEAKFVLTTDWSRTAIAAMLTQERGADSWVIAYASRLLTPAESNYGASEGECLAVVWGVHKFRYYLHRRAFTLRTDHAALQWLQSARFSNAKLERWALRLQEHRITVQHVKGTSNAVADHLSRTVVSSLRAVVAHSFGEAQRAASRVAVSSSSSRVAAVWPTHAATQKEVDAVQCTVCGDPGGGDNMAICDGCEQCMHLRCLLPPRTTPPSGPWLCPACDPAHANALAEMQDPHPTLVLHPADPLLNPSLLDYLAGGSDPVSLGHLAQPERRALQRLAGNVSLHPTIPGWLSVRCNDRTTGLAQRKAHPTLPYRWDLVQMVHEALGHAGISQTLHHLSRHWHWRGMKADVARVLQCCDACQRRRLILPEALEPQEPAMYGPFNHLHVDLTAPLPVYTAPPTTAAAWREPSGHKYVVIMVDSFTKVAEFGIADSKDPHAIAKVVWDHWLSRYPLPAVATTDNGTEFAEAFTHMLARLGIAHIHTSVAHPAANGVAERLVRTLKDMLRAHVNDAPFSWPATLPTLRMMYHHRVHRATGHAPIEVLTGMIPELPLPVSSVRALQLWTATGPEAILAVPRSAWPTSTGTSAEGCPAEECYNHVPALQDALSRDIMASITRQFALTRRLFARRRHAARLMRRRTCTLREGDLVLELLESPVTPLHAGVLGPFRILGFNKQRNVAILQTGYTAFRAPRLYRRHVSRLAKYTSRWDPVDPA